LGDGVLDLGARFLTFGDGVWISSNHFRPAAASEPKRAAASLVAGEQEGRRGRSNAGGPRHEWGKPAGAAGGQRAAGVLREAGERWAAVCQRRRRPRAASGGRPSASGGGGREP